jgi:TonB-linked SusC/RagA family outer membrane protein
MRESLRKVWMLVFLFSILSSHVFSQERTVSGRVTSSDDGSPLPGVNVLVKGTTAGTVTDADGKYTLGISGPDPVLSFSFIGLQTREIAVGTQTIVDVQMISDVTQLGEVVVTAVGIEREAKSLGFSVENVSASKVQQVAEADPLRALQGKVAGVNISGSSGMPGSSTRITIRGNRSLLGNNQPLFVVDGIPYNNDFNNTLTGLTGGGGYTSRIADLDPNNIESMTLLKGGAAAALYGSRAANGVVVITTKTGKARPSRKGVEIAFASTYGLEKISQLPELQNKYGTGTNFAYAQVNGSWGSPFPGTVPYTTNTTIPHWFDNRVGLEAYWGTTVPYRAYPNNVADQFTTGKLFENTVTISGGNEKSNLTAVVTHSTNDGYIPNTAFDRTSFSVGGRTVLENKLTLGTNLTYTKTFQHAAQTGTTGSVLARALFLGRNWDVLGTPYQNPVDLGSEYFIARSQADNPFWANRNTGIETNVNRVAASMDLNYDLNDWFALTYKIGLNQYVEEKMDFVRPGSTGPNGNAGRGRVINDDISFSEIESNFIATLSPKISDDISIRGLVGLNVNQRTRDRQAYMGVGYVVFDIDDIDNTNAVTPFGGDYSRRRILGVYSDINVGYKDWLFLNLTGRNDWSSTLPTKERSFFYPAVSLSAVISEGLGIESSTLTSLKIRGGWAQVGADTDPYQLQATYNVNSFGSLGGGTLPFKGIPGASLDDTARDPNLKPERTNSVEAGLEAEFFNGKLGIDATVYRTRSFDQIASINLPAPSGYGSLFTNFGEISNQGIELTVNATPVELSNGFSWNLTGTFTHNQNVIEELTTGISEIQFGSGFASGVIMVHRPGQYYGLLLGSVAARDDEGNFLIDPSNGQLLRSSERAIIGNPNPDFVLGLTNTFSFKGFGLTAVLDYRQGGEFFSNTLQSALGRGVYKVTEDREKPKIIPGVYGNANTLEPLRDEEGNKIPNTTIIEVNSLYFGETFAVNGADEFGVYDGTVLRLREVGLSYTFPKSLLAKTPFGSASIGLTGRNLWFHAPNVLEDSNFDPEINQFGNSNQQGIEYAAAPSVKRYAATIRFTF